MNANAPRPFHIDVADSVLADLQTRLALTRFPGEPVDAGWGYGANLDYIKRLAAYWQEQFDWRSAETGLNRFDQFLAPISHAGESLDIHFIHHRARREDAPAILLVHGWPGSFFEFMELVDQIARPEDYGGDVADAMHVVVPSLPGYGFSAAPKNPILQRGIATIFNDLMTQTLGYESYRVQGGDWGAVILSWSVLDHGKHIRAAHLNMPGLRPDLGPGTPALSEAEKDWLEGVRKGRLWSTGYQEIQATKSQTLSFGLTDSPVGLAAWIVEKFHGWTSPAAAEPPFSFDQLLTNVMIYWVSGCINSSTWLYRAMREREQLAMPEGRTYDVPVGFCLPKNDLSAQPPESWLKRYGDVRHYTRMPDGGHFTALEKGPALLADMLKFYRSVDGV